MVVGSWSGVVERVSFRRPSPRSVSCVGAPYRFRTRAGDRIYRRPLSGPFVWFWADIDDDGLRIKPLAPWRTRREVAITWNEVDQIDLDGDRVTVETASFEAFELWGNEKLSELIRSAEHGLAVHDRSGRTILVPVGYKPDWRTQSEKRGEPDWTRTRAARRRSDDQ